MLDESANPDTELVSDDQKPSSQEKLRLIEVPLRIPDPKNEMMFRRQVIEGVRQ